MNIIINARGEGGGKTYILITVPGIFKKKKNEKYTLMSSCLLQEDSGKRDLSHLYLNGFNGRVWIYNYARTYIHNNIRILCYVLCSEFARARAYTHTRFKALSEWDVKLHVGSLIFIFFFILSHFIFLKDYDKKKKIKKKKSSPRYPLNSFLMPTYFNRIY